MTTVREYADSMADYLATRKKPWRDEATMREAVAEVFKVMFGDEGAFTELSRLCREAVALRGAK